MQYIKNNQDERSQYPEPLFTKVKVWLNDSVSDELFSEPQESNDGKF